MLEINIEDGKMFRIVNVPDPYRWYCKNEVHYLPIWTSGGSNNIVMESLEKFFKFIMIDNYVMANHKTNTIWLCSKF